MNADAAGAGEALHGHVQLVLEQVADVQAGEPAAACVPSMVMPQNPPAYRVRLL